MSTENAIIHILHADPAMEIGLHAILSAHGAWTVTRGKLEAHDYASVQLFVTDYTTGMRLIREDGSGVPVIIVTERDKEWEVRSALEYGISGYLLQSCAPEEVVHAVQQVFDEGAYLSDTLSRRVADSFSRAALTPREHDVLLLLAEGCCNKLIARRLGIEVGTVKTHIKSIMAKLDASARTHAVIIAAERGLVTAGRRSAADAASCSMAC